MFKLRSLFGLGITAGHQLFYSTQMLDFFYLGVYNDELNGLKTVIFKLQEILFCLLILKNFLITTLKKNRLTLLLVFSNLNQYLVVCDLFDNSCLFNTVVSKNFFLTYFMLCPEVGFLSSPTQRR
jgi:hypothetical protein